MPIEVGSAVVFADGRQGTVRYLFSGEKGAMALIRLGNHRMRVAQVADLKLSGLQAGQPGGDSSLELKLEE